MATLISRLTDLINAIGADVKAVSGPRTTTLTNGTTVSDGSGAPEGAVTAPPGAVYCRTNGEVYQKLSGTGNTGWYRLMPIYVGTSAPSNTSILWLDSN